jgi:hypothetical protein
MMSGATNRLIHDNLLIQYRGSQPEHGPGGYSGLSTWRRNDMRLRQVRLKMKYWSHYPTVESGIWHGAGALVARVLLKHRGRPTFASLVGRPLPDAHFDFRYGDPARPAKDATTRTRWNDPTDRSP